MGSQTIIPKPEPRLVSGKKDYKVKKNDILELLNPKGTVSETQLKAMYKTIQIFRQRSCTNIRSQVQDTPYAKSSWGDIPWEKKAGEVKAFEQLVKEKTGINIRCCEANWAADYLIGTSYNNSNGDKRRKEKRKGLEASIEDNMNSFDSSNGGLRSVEDLNLMNITQSHGEASGLSVPSPTQTLQHESTQTTNMFYSHVESHTDVTNENYGKHIEYKERLYDVAEDTARKMDYYAVARQRNNCQI
ncbi:hypothetical protein BDC45DRAFT_542721 [Circinella umbellata]|nr:hypothetical protein BDC45DRAFT_542721 [Circinella umbellata]